MFVPFGYVKELVLNCVGYKAAQKGKILELLLGYSHPINFEIPDDLKVEVPKPTEIKITGIDKQRVGQIAANIKYLENLSHIRAKVLTIHVFIQLLKDKEKIMSSVFGKKNRRTSME